MKALTFQKAAKLRKLIRANASSIQVEAAKHQIWLSDDELLEISRKCQNRIIPGMDCDEVTNGVAEAMKEGIEQIKEERRLASSISPNS